MDYRITGYPDRETFWELTGLLKFQTSLDLAYKSLCGDILCDLGFEVYSSNDSFVVDIHHSRYFLAGFLATFDSKLRLVNKVEASLRESLIRPVLFPRSVFLSCVREAERVIACPPDELSRPPYAVVVSAVILLASVYQYLTGNVDRGGSKAYSRSSLDFRDIYVAIVLFLGAYVWIKFREVAPKGVYSRKLKDKDGRIIKVVHEPRFKPPRENGTVFEWIYLGQYDTPEEASMLYRIAAFYHNEDRGSSLQLDLEDGSFFSIPPMNEGERSLAGVEKRAWVKLQVMKVYEEFKKEKAEAAKRLQELQLERWEDEGVSNGHNPGPQQGSALPVSQQTPNTESGMGISSSNQLDFPQIVHNLQELITYQQQQLSLKDQQLLDCTAQISELKYQHYLQQQQLSLQEQQLQDCRAQISELEGANYLQQMLLVVNEGAPSNEVEMEQGMHLPNHEAS